ncbi:hypothetical protein B0H13DRAFT_1883274 [Mycena leptocephala]|nr:hypothetical protein B0H13DRAFT_1883274 [Mycena leptocephala]
MRRLSAHRAISPLNHPFTDALGHMTTSGPGFPVPVLSDCGNITVPWPSGWESTSLFECNLPCLGNGQELCGGTLDEGRFIAYSTLPVVATAPPEWLQQGCLNGGMHLLPHAPNVTIPSAEMTVEKCISACNNSVGYNASAGVISGDECWCGDYSATPGVLDRTNSCDECCTGNGREVCGGSGSMFIYSNPVVALQSYRIFYGNWSLQGCFVDISPCWSLSYSSAGVEMGNECWCGNITSPGVMVPMSDCNSRCMDDAFESCGGLNRLQVYHFQGTFN